MIAKENSMVRKGTWKRFRAPSLMWGRHERADDESLCCDSQLGSAT